MGYNFFNISRLTYAEINVLILAKKRKNDKEKKEQKKQQRKSKR